MDDGPYKTFAHDPDDGSMDVYIVRDGGYQYFDTEYDERCEFSSEKLMGVLNQAYAYGVEDSAATIARLTAENERLREPTHYWTDACEEFAVDDPQQIADEQWIDSAGATFEATPLHAMPKVYFGVVPDPSDDSAEWDADTYCGDLIVVGPFMTEAEAQSEANRLTRESALAARENKTGGE